MVLLFFLLLSLPVVAYSVYLLIRHKIIESALAKRVEQEIDKAMLDETLKHKEVQKVIDAIQKQNRTLGGPGSPLRPGSRFRA